MIEEMIVTDSGERPEEVRLFIFNGKVDVINTVFIENDLIRNGAFHTPDWTRLNWHFSRALNVNFATRTFSDMLACRMPRGRIDHVRVDFYDCGAGYISAKSRFIPGPGYLRSIRMKLILRSVALVYQAFAASRGFSRTVRTA